MKAIFDLQILLNEAQEKYSKCVDAWLDEKLKKEELERLIEEAPTVYMAKSYGHYDMWTLLPTDLDSMPTHTARLVGMTECNLWTKTNPSLPET